LSLFVTGDRRPFAHIMKMLRSYPYPSKAPVVLYGGLPAAGPITAAATVDATPSGFEVASPSAGPRAR
jgi:hypothetical protein